LNYYYLQNQQDMRKASTTWEAKNQKKGYI